MTRLGALRGYFKRLLASAPAMGLVAVLFAGGVSYGAMHQLWFLEKIEVAIKDFRTAWILPAEEQDPDIVIVAINEDTLKRFPYRSPIDREFIAKLLKTLADRGPKAIAVDLLFDQPTEPAKDALLKETLSSLPVPLFISYTDKPSIVNEMQRQYLEDYLPRKAMVRADVTTDIVDGRVRTIFPGQQRRDGSYMPGFARAVVESQGVKTPSDEIDMVWHGRPNPDTPSFKTFPAHMVPLLPPAWFKNKIVLVGATLSLTDIYPTPFSTKNAGQKSEMPGIEIHAHAVSQLLRQREVRKFGTGPELALVAGAAVAGVALAVLPLGVALRGLSLTAVIGVFWAAAFKIFASLGVTVPLVEPSIAFLLSGWAGDALTGREARRQKEFINSAFGRYVNPELVRQLASDPAKLSLGGESREMTLMFMDIRGFTTLSERYDAHGLTQFLNRFLTPMTQVILEAHGTVDKYMGDAIMAFWNAPLDDPRHAEHACRAALRMRAELERLNGIWKAEAEAEGKSYHQLKIGIGLNTGICCVGNVGSDQRFDYSVLGDDVNLCSRLEGQSKNYGVDIVIGENTAPYVAELATLELDLIQVKGKTRPVRIHVLFGDEEVTKSAAFAALKTVHDSLLAAYRACFWEEARGLLARYRELAPPLMQGFADLYEDRVTEYERHPPPEGWDGAYVATSK